MSALGDIVDRVMASIVTQTMVIRDEALRNKTIGRSLYMSGFHQGARVALLTPEVTRTTLMHFEAVTKIDATDSEAMGLELLRAIGIPVPDVEEPAPPEPGA